MAGSSSAASSLYSGIFDRQKEASSGNAISKEGQSNEKAALVKDGSTDADISSSENVGQINEPATNTQVWSAALRFAPRKPVNSSKARRPIAAYLSASVFANAENTEEKAVDEDESSKRLRGQPPAPAPVLPAAERSIASLVRGEVKVHALNLGAEKRSLADLPQVTEPPPLIIPPEELDEDRAVFRARSENRGEGSSRRRQYDNGGIWDVAGSDEDVNGFQESTEGKKVKKKRRRGGIPGHRGGLSASLNMDADYDVRVPNDFLAFKQLLAERRRIQQRLERAQAAESEAEDEEQVDRYRHSRHFAPPPLYLQPKDQEEKAYISPPPPPGPPPVRPSAAPAATSTVQAMSGEEAYMRRVALSQQSQLSAPQLPDDFEARAAAAAAIAARLASIAPPPPSEDSIREASSKAHDASTFAERLMARQGWQKGEALGAEGNKGILDPIVAERVRQEKRKIPAHISGNRGTIHNAQEDGRKREEVTRYGEPSEVLLLQDMLSSDDDIDDDLPQEIAGECGKHGYVQRVFILPSYSSSNAETRQRGRPLIFVRFTGMAGAWRCLKELDGRFFAGNSVRARYYPTHEFESGNYDDVV